MGLAAKKPEFAREDYLTWESAQPDRHEYLAGEVFAMVGVRDQHNAIGGNLYVALHSHLRGSPCRPYFADVKLEVVAADSIFYPDLFVTCESPSDPLVKRDARLIVEILSPSTEAYDRGRKFACYRLLPGFQEYMLLSADEALIEVYTRTGDGAWLLREYRGSDRLTLSSIDLALSVDAIYDAIDFSEPGAASEALNAPANPAAG